MKNIIIAPSEVIAIIEHKQKTAKTLGLADPVGMFAQKQAAVCEYYLDAIVSDIAHETGRSEDLVLLTAEPKQPPKTIHIMGNFGQKRPEQLKIEMAASQITDHALEAKIVTEAENSEVHIPSTKEVLEQVATKKLPETVNFVEEGIRESVLNLYRSGNKVAAIKLVIKYYSDPRFADGKLATNFNQAMVIINEWLGIDPLKTLKQKIASLYESGPTGYTLAFRFVQENLTKMIPLTGNEKEDASLMHKFTWDVINNYSQTRREQMAGRASKKVAQTA